MFYTKQELLDIGFIQVGDDTRVSKKSVFHGIKEGVIGNSVRIDDFSTLKGNIKIGNHVHISSFCSISGTGGEIKIEDFAVCLLTVPFLLQLKIFINPTLTSPSISSEFSKIISGDIKMESASKLGASCIVLPNTTIGFGSSASANTIISSDVKEGAIIGPKSRHFKTYGYRKIDGIKDLMHKFLKDD